MTCAASSTIRSSGFLRAAEALTGAPVSWGNDVELLINGDQIFPCYLRTIREAQRDALPAHLRLLARRDRPRGRGRAVRARGGGRRVQRDHRRRRRDEARARGDRADARRGRPRDPLPPAQALRGQARGQPHPPQDPHRRRARRADRRGRHRGGVDGRRRGHRPLARHARARRGAGGARAVRRVRRELAGGDRRGARRRRVPARARGNGGRRADDGRALERRRRRLQRRGALLPRDRRRERVARPDRGLLRAAPGVHGGAPGRGRARRARARARPGLEHRQAAGLDRGPRVLRRARRLGRRGLRVPADDAAREDDDRRRLLVRGRLGELRQPLVPAQRRGDAVRQLRRTSPSA